MNVQPGCTYYRIFESEQGRLSVHWRAPNYTRLTNDQLTSSSGVGARLPGPNNDCDEKASEHSLNMSLQKVFQRSLAIFEIVASFLNCK